MVVVPRYTYIRPLWYYDPWFDLDYQWGGVYGPYGYPPYHRYSYDPGSAVKLEVKPKKAEVYVDGYYAGIVDDFDGAFQRLRIPPGEHEIDLYLDGYRSVHQKIYLTPDNTFKLKYSMEKLAAGEQPDPRPQPATPPAGQIPPQAGQPYPAPGPQTAPAYPPAPRTPPRARAPQDERRPPDPRGPVNAASGTLAIRVQPEGAEVVIDGEPWRGPQGQERLFVDVAEGRHTIEIRKAGYRTYVTDVDIRRGETTPLNVSLRSQDQQ